MSILTIGVLTAVGGGRAVRRQAELASRRAAEALAAQQVLELRDAGRSVTSADTAWTDTVWIGLREVRVRVETQHTLPGLTRIHVTSDAGTGTKPWELETLRVRD